MFDGIGMGLALNVLLWIGGLVIACCIGVFAIMEFMPRDPSEKPGHERSHGRRHSPPSAGASPG